MKNSLVLIIYIILLFSCSPEKDSSVVEGYFYDQNGSEIYFLSGDKLTNYNFLDSTVNTQKIKLDSNNITINNLEYNYKNHIDSLIIYDYGQEQLKLNRIQYSNFEIEDLAFTEWEVINSHLGDSIRGFIRFQNDGSIFEFFKWSNALFGEYGRQDFLVGKYFDKFYVYSSSMPYVLTNVNEDLLVSFSINEDYRFDRVTFKRSMNEKLDSKYQGKWSKINDTLSRNIYALFDYSNRVLDMRTINIDSIKREYNFSKIEFTEDSLFILSTEDEKNIKKFRKDLTYSPALNLIFYNDKEEEPQYLEVQFLSRDTIDIQFPEPYLFYTYVRDSVSN